MAEQKRQPSSRDEDKPEPPKREHGQPRRGGSYRTTKQPAAKPEVKKDAD